MAMQFFQLNAIDINPAKSELLVINSGDDGSTAPNVSLAGSLVQSLPPATAAHMLGVWFSADFSNKHTHEIVHTEVASICKMIGHKSVTDVQAVYIINNVLIPIVLYHLTCTVLSASELKSLVGKYTSIHDLLESCPAHWSAQ